MSRSNTKKIVGTILFVVGFLNFVAFFVICSYLGGDAGNGHVADGHYFLGNHGAVIETTRGIFEYSRFHVRSLFVTHPLALFGVWLAFGMRQRPAAQA
jgi:hypothetical protein